MGMRRREKEPSVLSTCKSYSPEHTACGVISIQPVSTSWSVSSSLINGGGKAFASSFLIGTEKGVNWLLIH